MKVLLSIKPEFAEKIFDGTKLYEFRRSIFKNKNIVDYFFIFSISIVGRMPNIYLPVWDSGEILEPILFS